MEAARAALVVDDEPNSDLIEYIAGYSPRSAVYHQFRSMTELFDSLGIRAIVKPLPSVSVPPSCLDLSAMIPPVLADSRGHKERTNTATEFVVWQKVNGGMRLVTLSRCVDRICFATGILLYAGEGTKSLLSARVELANCDPGILRLFIKFLGAIGIPLERLQARVQIHDPNERREAEKLWASELGLTPHQFTKPLFHKPGEAVRRRTFTLHLRFQNTMLLRLMRHWTSNLEDVIDAVTR